MMGLHTANGTHRPDDRASRPAPGRLSPAPRGAEAPRPPELFREDELVHYDTIEARRVDLVQQAQIYGWLTPARKADLFFRYQGGRLTNLAVAVNDTVSPGQLLAELNVGNLEIQIEQRRILLEKARLNHEMLQVSGPNRYQVTLAALDVRLAELQLQDLEQSFANLRLESPFGGTVVRTSAREGEYIEAFKPITRVVDPTRLLLECGADTESAASFLRGAGVDVLNPDAISEGTSLARREPPFEQYASLPGVAAATKVLRKPAVRARALQFGVLRAMGLARNQSLSMLGWEQLLISGSAVAAPISRIRIHQAPSSARSSSAAAFVRRAAPGYHAGMAATPLGRDAMAIAIVSEIRVRDLYRETATRVANRRGKRRLARLARDEEGHRATLQSRYRHLTGEEFTFDPASPGGPSFDFVKHDVFTQAGALEVVSVAISAETESIVFYGRQLDSVTEAEDVRLLRRLVTFEQGHKKSLQREYDRLSKRFTWAG